MKQSETIQKIKENAYFIKEMHREMSIVDIIFPRCDLDMNQVSVHHHASGSWSVYFGMFDHGSCQINSDGRFQLLDKKNDISGALKIAYKNSIAVLDKVRFFYQTSDRDVLNKERLERINQLKEELYLLENN